MEDVNEKIERFCTIFLPPADNIATSDPARKYIKVTKPPTPPSEALSLVNALASNIPKDIGPAQHTFEAIADAIDVASRPAAKQWLHNVFSALETHLAQIPRMAGQYANDILYIVTTPEFGLNGFQESDPADEWDGKKWDARGAFPSSLETYIRDVVCIKLRSDPFNHFHILFVFSCFTHSTSTMVSLVEPGINGPQKIVANNRLNVICVGSPMPDSKAHVHTITKFAWNPVADMVKEELFTSETAWDSISQANIFGMEGKRRSDHTQITLPWSDKDDSPVVLGFGTCQDVRVDQHLTERMVILCGSGTPFIRLPEAKDLPMSYPFLLNDTQSWSVYPSIAKERLRSDQLQSAGYYQFLPKRPDDLQSIAEKFANIPEPSRVPRSQVDRPNMSECYLYPTPHESNQALFAAAIKNETTILVSTTAAHMPQAPLFKYTDVLPLPPARLPLPPTGESKGDNCIIS
jgi:hypothetical protein